MQILTDNLVFKGIYTHYKIKFITRYRLIDASANGSLKMYKKTLFTRNY